MRFCLVARRLPQTVLALLPDLEKESSDAIELTAHAILDSTSSTVGRSGRSDRLCPRRPRERELDHRRLVIVQRHGHGADLGHWGPRATASPSDVQQLQFWGHDLLNRYL